MADDRPVFLAPMQHNALLTWALAPFFPRYKVLQDLEKEPAHLRGTLRNLIMTEDRRFLYLRNQKCACTQTTQILYAYGHKGETYPGNVHRANEGIVPARYRWRDIKPVFEGHMSFFFTFVRDPEVRLLSAFRNFFVDNTNLARRKHLGPMTAHGYDPAKPAGYNFDVFLDYIAHTFDVDRTNCDTHWRLQVDNIGWRDIRYDFIGRVERYEADIAHVFAAGGVTGFPPPALLQRRENRSSGARFAISPEQRARIHLIYAPDYEAFGYPA
jgi:hypothetical protein